MMLVQLFKNLFKSSETVKYPFETKGLNFPERLRGEHAINQELCNGCGRCARVCPSFVIEMVPLTPEEKAKRTDKKKEKPVIELAGCIFCGECEAVCPKDAIKLTNVMALPSTDKFSMTVI